MANELPHPDRVRALLTDKRLPAAELDRTGDLYWDAGRPNVAVMFYERSKTRDRLERVRDWARKEGDEFLLSAVAKVDAAFVKAEDWVACGEAALARRKFGFARDAFRKGGDEARASQAQEQYLKIFPGPA